MVYCKQIVLVLDGNTDLIGLKDEEHLERKKSRDGAVPLKAYTIGYFKFHKTGKGLMKQLMALLKDKTSLCTNLSQQECTKYKESLLSQNFIKSDGKRCFTPVNSSSING